MPRKKPEPKTKLGTSKEATRQRKEKFAFAYMTNGNNATQAAKAAGFPATTAHTDGWMLKNDPEVRAILDEERKRVLSDHRHDLDTLVNEFAQIGLFDIRAVLDEDGRLLPPAEWPSFAGKVISSIDINEMYENDDGDKRLVGYLKKVKLWSKTDALDKLVRILGGYEKDNTQLGDAIGRAIVVPAKEGQR